MPAQTVRTVCLAGLPSLKVEDERTLRCEDRRRSTNQVLTFAEHSLLVRFRGCMPRRRIHARRRVTKKDAVDGRSGGTSPSRVARRESVRCACRGDDGKARRKYGDEHCALAGAERDRGRPADARRVLCLRGAGRR